MELNDLLTRELRCVAAPAGLWSRVEARLDSPDRYPRRIRETWALAASVLVVAGLTLYLSSRRAIDLGAYLAPVQEATQLTSAAAIAQAPPHFEPVRGPHAASVAGYPVAAERVRQVGGETVRQVILTAADQAVALFISSPKVRLDAGANRWVDGKIDGVSYKRLNCPRVRTARFACLQQTCVLICKACSDQALAALMTGVSGLR